VSCVCSKFLSEQEGGPLKGKFARFIDLKAQYLFLNQGVLGSVFLEGRKGVKDVTGGGEAKQLFWVTGPWFDTGRYRMCCQHYKTKPLRIGLFLSVQGGFRRTPDPRKLLGGNLVSIPTGKFRDPCCAG